MTRRALNAEEQRLWGAVMATVRPLRAMAAPMVKAPAGMAAPRMDEAPRQAGVLPRPLPPLAPVGSQRRAARSVTVSPATVPAANTLDGGWDKRLSRGTVAPDASIDLHGHTLASAHALLDAGLARSIGRGDRVLLLVTGKPPRAESERPHARGAIRAAVADWLGASRHADAIAAVRGAHPRHGGAGALYIVLRRPRTPA
jgi:DNA-nicking Smr family endonuclease